MLMTDWLPICVPSFPVDMITRLKKDVLIIIADFKVHSKYRPDTKHSEGVSVYRIFMEKTSPNLIEYSKYNYQIKYFRNKFPWPSSFIFFIT